MVVSVESLLAIIYVLVGIISALVAGHYVSVVWEVRKLREEIAGVRKDITDAAIAAANAATTAAQVASKFLDKKQLK